MNQDLPDFFKFSKIPRWNREVVVTEKIDGTNAQIYITPEGDIYAGSRNRWITPEDDNHGFAKWVEANKESLLELGPGRHYGEWWGPGIQRKYSAPEKTFSLFNTSKWDQYNTPDCVSVVPIIWRGLMEDLNIDEIMWDLSEHGSYACPGFPSPEGIVIYHIASGHYFKKTFENDEGGKG